MFSRAADAGGSSYRPVAVCRPASFFIPTVPAFDCWRPGLPWTGTARFGMVVRFPFTARKQFAFDAATAAPCQISVLTPLQTLPQRVRQALPARFTGWAAGVIAGHTPKNVLGSAKEGGVLDGQFPYCSRDIRALWTLVL